MPFRVLLVTHNYPRFTGDSAGAFIARLGEDLVQRGCEVRVLTPDFEATPDEDPGPPAVRRFRYAPTASQRIGYTGDVRGQLRDIRRLARLPSYLRAFGEAYRRECADFRPDVVHAHWWFPSGWIAARGAPALVVTCHGSDVHLLADFAPARLLARGVFRRARAITTVSTYLRDRLVRCLPESEGRLSVTRMGVDLARFEQGRGAPKADPPRILYAGYLVEGKGVDVLLRALAVLRARGVRADLRILGRGPAEPGLRALAESLGVAGGIEWSSLVPQDKMPMEYGAATVNVLPSRGNREGLGLTLVEALAAGTAVVATPAGGIPEVVVDRVTGLLAPDGDAPALAGAIEQLIVDADLRAKLVEQGGAHVRRLWGRDACVRETMSVYHSVAPRADSPGR